MSKSLSVSSDPHSLLCIVPGGGGVGHSSTGDVPLDRVPFLSFQLWHVL